VNHAASPHKFSRVAAAAAVALLALSSGPDRCAAQAPLYFVDGLTTTESVSFRFASTESFDESTLLDEMATTSAGFWDKVLFWRRRVFRFDPVVLQKDVVRLRQFYNRNGFIYPQISYTSSVLDTARNEIKVVVEIDEGPPLIIQDVGYYSPGGDYAVTQFPESQRQRWERFSTEIALRIGDRYSEFQRISIQSRVLNWLLDNGYAFGRVDASTNVDSTWNVVDVRFIVDTGPETFVDSVLVEGNESVARNVITREIPIRPGRRYSRARLVRGQQELFELNLFRVVLADVPHQPRDSTVTVRYRVRESRFRVLSAQLGYSFVEGLGSQASWQNRNFFGGARNLSVGIISNTGLLAKTSGNNQTPWKLQANVSLSQPYFLSSRTSAIVVPYILFERDPRLRESDRFYGMNRREIGLETTLIYRLVRLRTLTGKYVFNRTLNITQPIINDPSVLRDPYTKSILSLTGNFGRTNDLLRPTRGFEVHPFVEYSSASINSDIQYIKGGSDAVVYIPITEDLKFTARVFAGTARPFGFSRRALNGDAGSLATLTFENRFDPVFFEAGGSNDVRGWADGFLGAKSARSTLRPDGSVSTYVYEPAGGRSKWTASATLLYPFPGLGSNWQLATFVDAGQVSSKHTGDGSTPIVDDGSFDFSRWRVGVGAGMRYATPFGFVRLDLGYKVNPSANDLRTPEEAFFNIDERRLLQRFRLHLSLSQTF
jgi:outer membrane protein insertion porin family